MKKLMKKFLKKIGKTILIIFLLIGLIKGLGSCEKNRILNGRKVFDYNDKNVKIVDETVKRNKVEREEKGLKEENVAARIAFLKGKDGTQIVILDKNREIVPNPVVKFFRWLGGERIKELKKGTFVFMSTPMKEVLTAKDIRDNFEVTRYQVLKEIDYDEISKGESLRGKDSPVFSFERAYMTTGGMFAFNIPEGSRQEYLDVIDEKIKTKVGFQLFLDLDTKNKPKRSTISLLYLPKYTMRLAYGDMQDWKEKNIGFNEKGHIQFFITKDNPTTPELIGLPYNWAGDYSIVDIYDEEVPVLDRMNKKWEVLKIKEVSWEDISIVQDFNTIPCLDKLISGEEGPENEMEQFYIDVHQFVIQKLEENGKMKN